VRKPNAQHYKQTYMKNKILASLLVANLGLGLAETSAHWTSKRPDGHAPIGVMADHKHGKGEWMASYRYMFMEMEGIDTFGPYTMMRPTSMDMEMHMFGAMYAPSDKVTLMLMGNHIEKDMGMINMGGMTSNMNTSDWGDLTLSGLFDIKSWGEETLIGTIGLGMPTGSIDLKNGAGAQLPYGMQTGSGTWDLKPGITYLGQNESYSWGAQANATIRLGDNDHGYSFGDNICLTGWAAKKLNDNLSISARLNAHFLGSIDGTDENITMMMAGMSAPNDASNSGGEVYSAGVGFNYLFTNGHRLALEYTNAFENDLNGYQMEFDSTVTVGWQYAW